MHIKDDSNISLKFVGLVNRVLQLAIKLEKINVYYLLPVRTALLA
jgi:hypothetical protein